MSYEFRKKWPKIKHKFNKREKVKNQKLDTKNKKIKQKNMTNKQWLKEEMVQKGKGEISNLTWDDISIDNSLEVLKWYLSWKDWKFFDILDKTSEKNIEATLSEDIPSYLKWTFVIWDIVYYVKFEWEYIIKKRWNRKNYLSKTRSNTSRFWWQKEQIVAANIDLAVIVMPVKEPVFDHKLLDRYLVLCQYRWVKPLICLNKIDLVDSINWLLNEYEKAWIDIVEVSVIENKWIDVLKKLLINNTSVLLWKSGVWKSSITNELCDGLDILTQEVNKKSGEGRHTTTATNLYVWDKNSYIVDTPGVRALWVDQIQKFNLKNLFPEFLEYKWKCKYSKCIHNIEPDCAVKKALEEWKISKYRYESYLRILSDLV
jgi:ribosome biogenesis GTPase